MIFILECFMADLQFPNGYPSKTEVLKLLKDTYEAEKDNVVSSDDIQIISDGQKQLTQESSDKTTEHSSKAKKKRNIFERLHQHRSSLASKEKNIDEIEHYISTPAISEKENSLSFWRQNEDRYPVLSVLALKYLSMPATSASVERLFSVGGSIISSRRSSMAIETAEKLILYKDYLLQGKIELN